MPERYTDTPLLGERFDLALLMATRHHARQLRKGGDVPYVAHLLSVCGIALEMGATEDEAIAALLHDLVEDGGGLAGLERIRRAFGADVARMVEANSDTVSAEKEEWEPRKRAYLAAIADKQADELRVSLADKLHNARSILLDYRTHGDTLWDRFKTGEGESVRWYYRELLQAFGARRDALGPLALPVLEEFERVVTAIEELAAA